MADFKKNGGKNKTIYKNGESYYCKILALASFKQSAVIIKFK